MPGDTITVHAGVYRERVAPPRGGTSDAKRIVYQAASGENVVITWRRRGEGWTKGTRRHVEGVAIPNHFFGASILTAM